MELLFNIYLAAALGILAGLLIPWPKGWDWQDFATGVIIVVLWPVVLIWYVIKN